jgi:hypothetical protein
MPDGDRIPFGIYGRWRKVFRLLDAHDSVERVADNVAGALASEVRLAGGLAGLGEVTRGTRAEASTRRPPMVAAGDRSEEASKKFTGAVALALNDHLALTSSPQAGYIFAERLVMQLAWSKFDPMIKGLVGDEKYTAVELYELFRKILSDEVIGKLIRRILRHPSGEGLRTPNQRWRKLSPDELLNTDLGNL